MFFPLRPFKVAGIRPVADAGTAPELVCRDDARPARLRVATGEHPPRAEFEKAPAAIKPPGQVPAPMLALRAKAQAAVVTCGTA